jgi:hypothetical protein
MRTSSPPVLAPGGGVVVKPRVSVLANPGRIARDRLVVADPLPGFTPFTLGFTTTPFQG